jgi:hypothetical protein
MNKYKQAWQTAALIAEMMRRSGQTRARISEKTMMRLSGRKRLEASVREQIRLDAIDYGYLVHRLNPRDKASGHVVVSIDALASGKPIKAVDLFEPDEVKKIVAGTFNFDALHADLLGEGDSESDDGASE